MVLTHFALGFDPFADMLTCAWDPMTQHLRTSKRTITTVVPHYRSFTEDAGSVLEVELPGVDKTSIELDIQGKSVSLKASRNVQSTRPNDRFESDANGEAPSPPGAVENTEPATVNEGPPEQNEDDTARSQKLTQHATRYEAKFMIGHHVDRDGVTAKLYNGLLEIRLPKPATEKSRRIEITA